MVVSVRYNDVFIKREYKKYRLDLNMWESKIVFGLFTLYLYEVWKSGAIIGYKRLTPVKDGKYFNFTELAPLTITQDQIKEIYGGNKWVVPQNYKVVEHMNYGKHYR